MSTISHTADRHADAGAGLLAAAATAARRVWAALVVWRVEQAAIMLLGSMSDRELNDLGLARSEIASAVRGERACR